MLESAIVVAIFVALIGIIYAAMRGRICGVEEKMERRVSKAFCDERHTHLVEDMKKGDAKFAAILETQTKMLQSLSRIEGRLDKAGG